ncbi:hypothetical protein GCM10008983_15680 [Lentibacillus halophilus]|uniref:Uncharacterized protein n=1 Tax=Lentibacillus halophilus TaxID=295065 RepID=A0ABN0Z938_9BACI
MWMVPELDKSTFNVNINGSVDYSVKGMNGRYEKSLQWTGKTMDCHVIGIHPFNYDAWKFDAYSHFAGDGKRAGYIQIAIKLHYYSIFRCGYFPDSGCGIFVRQVWEKECDCACSDYYWLGRPIGWLGGPRNG